MKFSWHEKFTRACDKLPDDMFCTLVRAVLAYGTDGVEPDLAFPLNAIFESFREDIDCSHRMRSMGKTGGRGNKKEAALSAGEAESKGFVEALSQSEKALSVNTEALSESQKALSQSEKALTQYSTVQDSAVHISTEQSRAGQGDARQKTRFNPPSAEDVRQYCIEQQIYVDPNQFVDHFQANGWKIGGKTPMKDWRTAVRNWARRQAEFDQQRGGGAHAPAHDVYSLL